MNRKEERELKKLIRAKRVELLDRQKELDIQHCQQCSRDRRTNNDCIGCEVFNELRSIGRELMNLSNGNFEIVRKETEPVATKTTGTEINGLTVEKYQELQKNGLSDIAIREQYEIKSNSQFHNWKKRNGLVKERGRKVSKVEPSVNTTETKQLEEANEHLLKKHDEMQKENEQLRKEIENLSKELITVRDEKYELMKKQEKLREEKGALRNRLTEVEEEYEKLHDLKHELTQNIEKANEIIEELREENEKLKSISERGEYYMKLSFMLMEGVVRELKEDAN